MAKSKGWISKTADRVERQTERRKGRDGTIVCASGVTPSGNIHLGNLREVMTVHLVAEELRSRGWRVEHIHSWDDFDRFRKIPAGIPEEFAQYLGQPVGEIPDPFGVYESYSHRYMAEFESSAEQLGIKPRYIRQSEAYRRGDYVPHMKTALEQRSEIFSILSEYQTLDHFEKTVEERRLEYYPIRVYCEECNIDDTNVTDYDQSTSGVTYECTHCGHEGHFLLDEGVKGKLPWKVDWPMRWSFEKVDFEPAGEDHSAPGSSFTVGKRLVRDIYDWQPPYYIGYAFVGMSGRSKISSSAGTNATPAAALEILEPSIIRWLYIRARINHNFTIDFGQGLLRLYDEWDRFVKRIESGKASARDLENYQRCVQTSYSSVKRSELPVSFRLLSSAADITQGDIPQILRIVSDHLDDPPPLESLQAKLEPRLSCAIRWATQYLPDDERTVIKEEFDMATYDTLNEQNKRGIQLLVDQLGENWSVKGLTQLVYGIPKVLLGHPMDSGPTPEIKQSQRSYFISLYQLITGSDTGPRLPTLLLSLGQERVRQLLVAPSDQ